MTNIGLGNLDTPDGENKPSTAAVFLQKKQDNCNLCMLKGTITTTQL